MIKKAIKVFLFIAFVIAFNLSTFGWREEKNNFTAYTSAQKTIARDLKSHVKVLSEDIGWRGVEQSENLEKAAQYIFDFLATLGYKIESQEFYIKDKKIRNIIAEKKGTKNPTRVVTVGAHYDTLFNPGADNNASGVAALLELAKALSGEDFNLTVRFIAFANAEPPFFNTTNMGSFVYLKRAKIIGEAMEAAIILDSLGYYDVKDRTQRYPPFAGFFYPRNGDFVAVCGNLNSFGLLRTVESQFMRNTSLSVKSFVGFDFIDSDHFNFWKTNQNAVLITDTGPYRNSENYSLADTTQRLNYLYMAQIVDALSSVLKSIAK